MIVKSLSLLLLAAFLQSPGCKDAAPEIPATDKNVNRANKELKMNQEVNPKVEEWVKEPPFDDPLEQQKKPDFSYEDWFKRGRALPNAVESLIELLKREDLENPSGIGMCAAYGVGWIGDKRPQISEALLRCLASKDLNLRIEAVAALGRQGDASIVPTLAKLLLDKNENINVRGNACISIGRLKAPSSEKLLTDALNDAASFIVLCDKEGLRLLRENHSPQS